MKLINFINYKKINQLSKTLKNLDELTEQLHISKSVLLLV